MLQPLDETHASCAFPTDKQDQCSDSHSHIEIQDASFPTPFRSGLEYGAPARGTWNIVHTGMLIPQTHQIFVCADSCLRGVVLTAAEMHAMHRFSTISVRENNLLDGDMENLILDGVDDILHKLKYKPRAILLYTSCIHHFVGCDLPLVYKTLRKRYPEIDFTDCYMNPIMRKSMLTPDQLMRRQLYSLLKDSPKNNKSVNIIGNNLETARSSELCQIIKNAGYELKEITSCHTYEEYQTMAESIANISYNPAAKAGGDVLEQQLGQKHLYLPLSYGYEEIRANLLKLVDFLRQNSKDQRSEQSLQMNNKHNESEHDDDFDSLLDIKSWIVQCEQALMHLSDVLKDTPVVIDYTATMRPLGLARLLLSHGIQVKSIYLDSCSLEEKKDFDWLQQNYPDLMLYATIQAEMRFSRQTFEQKVVAIGQKAAYFTQTAYFVNMVEGGGLYGYDGICKLCDWIIDAYYHEKDTKKLIQIKGLGCDCV